jgi:hypothetical protein
VITWCESSTYETAIGAYCAAYDSTLKCVNNYLCNTQLPAPCVSSGETKKKKIFLNFFKHLKQSVESINKLK